MAAGKLYLRHLICASAISIQGSSLPRYTCAVPGDCWLPGEGENGPDSVLPSQVCCTAGAAGQQKTQGISSPKGAQLLKLLQWDKSSMQKRHREQHNQKEQFLVATGLLNQFSYPTMYRQCQSKSNKNPKLSMISNKQTKNK